MNLLKAISFVVAFLGLALASSQDICTDYYCVNSMSRLECQPITNVLLDQLIIKGNPKLQEMANCQAVDSTDNPSEDLIVWLRHKNNNLREIRNHQFSNYRNLNVLMLNDNKIQILHNETFQGLSRLEFLHLQNNWISNLPEGIFYPLNNIAWIDLSNNRIASLPENIFPFNRTLKGLDLRKNPLTKIVIPNGHPIKAIDYLFLNDCAQLKEVELAIVVLKLTLDNSRVESVKISGIIKSIQAENSKLTHLDLRKARLGGSLSDLLCTIHSLEWLDLSSTALNDDRIHQFSSSHYSECLLPNLRFLNLSNNFIRSLPMGSPLFGPHLTTLDLSSNHLQNLSLDSLTEAHSLRSLDVNNNFLTTFDNRSLVDQFKNLNDFTFYGNRFNDTFNDAMTKYWNQRLLNEEQKMPKDEEGQEVQEAPQEPKVEKEPKDLKTQTVEATPSDHKDVDEEQKNDYVWIWIAVPIIVVLVMAVVWLMLKKRCNGFCGCQPL